VPSHYTYSLAPKIKQSFSGFYKALKPLAGYYAKVAGHRKIGLKYDDLLIEEREDMQKVGGNGLA
jgi:ubiquinol-cytochrome c reductase subunit 7